MKTPEEIAQEIAGDYRAATYVIDGMKSRIIKAIKAERANKPLAVDALKREVQAARNMRDSFQHIADGDYAVCNVDAYDTIRAANEGDGV